MPIEIASQNLQDGALADIILQCPEKYSLTGPQIEPAASFWNHCPSLRIIEVSRLAKINFPLYPTDKDIVAKEMQELLDLSMRRDDPSSLAGMFQNDLDTRRSPISKFLNDAAFRPPPLGSVAASRGNNKPLIETGRGLARYFESETPGIAHRQALSGLILNVSWSPPRQALVWAALDVTIASALMAAWYFKWIKGLGTSFRPRPVECYPALNVLYDNPDELNPMVLPCPAPDTETKRYSRGTPRHPAYPSGHSTYAGAASRLLSWFFPSHTAELDNLADNAGMARLWAGIHWRSDHIQGVNLGKAVADLVIDDLIRSGIEFPAPTPPPCDMSAQPPDIEKLQANAMKFQENCGTGSLKGILSDPVFAPELGQSVQAGGV